MSDVSASPRLVLPPAHVFVERKDEQPLDPWIENAVARVIALGARWRQRKALHFGHAVFRRAEGLQSLDETEFDAALAAARRQLANSARRSDGIEAVAAVIAEASRRCLGLSPFPVQIAAGYAMFSGCAAEMDTGEGKTLATMIGAALHGLDRRRVHVVAANDYLAVRDAEEMMPAYTRLGLSLKPIDPDMEPDERREVYRNQIVYVSSKEVAFDYLRDRLSASAQRGDRDIGLKTARLLAGSDGRSTVLPGLDVALVDEIDSVLIDDAGTPLLISQETGAGSAQLAAEALELVGRLSEDQDYRIDRLRHVVEFTDKGLKRIEALAAGKPSAWRQRIRREELASQALSALHLFKRDEHYIVRDDKVVIVDGNTGRTMGDRFWGQGLHQMIELKEGLVGSNDKRPLISTTYQRFFRRYRALGGTSGTIGEVAHEIGMVYRLKPVRIPRRQRNKRVSGGRHIVRSEQALWEAVAKAASERCTRGQPVLIGTRSVDEAEAAAAALAARDLSHVVLSAAQDADEAAIVAEAGVAGRITVATNIAGRGTDIRLDDDAKTSGGLSVFLCQRHASRRVDRQLIGRSARQGDPGEMLEFVSLDDRLLRGLKGVSGRLIRWCVASKSLAGPALRYGQLKREANAAQQRKRLVESDRRMAQLLAFSGGLE